MRTSLKLDGFWIAGVRSVVPKVLHKDGLLTHRSNRTAVSDYSDAMSEVGATVDDLDEFIGSGDPTIYALQDEFVQFVEQVSQGDEEGKFLGGKEREGLTSKIARKKKESQRKSVSRTGKRMVL